MFGDDPTPATDDIPPGEEAMVSAFYECTLRQQPSRTRGLQSHVKRFAVAISCVALQVIIDRSMGARRFVMEHRIDKCSRR